MRSPSTRSACSTTGATSPADPRHTADAVEASEIEEAARTAGLHPGGPFNLPMTGAVVKLAPLGPRPALTIGRGRNSRA